MARKARIFVPYAIYHVYCRVGRGEMVFASDDEAKYWLQTVREAAQLHQLTVLAWCLMSNHYHLVLRSGVDPIWRAMARIQRRISWYHNQLLGVQGRFWQSRYKARLILDEQYFEQIVAYVHLNPVAAGLVDDPADHRWSGHSELIGLADHQLINIHEALMSFGEDLPQRREAYLRLVRQIQEQKWLKQRVRKLPWWQNVADNEQTIEDDHAPDNAVWFDGDRLALHEADPVSLADLRRWFENAHPSSRGRLAARSQTTEDCHSRRLFTLLATLEMGHPNIEVARALQRNPSSVSRWLSEGLALKNEDPAFSQQLEELIKRLRRDILQL